MLLLRFAGLGFAGYRRTPRRPAAPGRSVSERLRPIAETPTTNWPIRSLPWNVWRAVTARFSDFVVPIDLEAVTGERERGDDRREGGAADADAHPAGS